MNLVGGTVGYAAIRAPKGRIAREAADIIMAGAENPHPAPKSDATVLPFPADRYYHNVVQCSNGSI